MKDTILRYLRMPGTWTGVVSAVSGIVSARYGDPVGAIVSQALLFIGGVLIAAPL